MIVVWNKAAVLQMSIVMQMARDGGRLWSIGQNNGDFKRIFLVKDPSEYYTNKITWPRSNIAVEFLVDTGCWLFLGVWDTPHSVSDQMITNSKFSAW